MVLRDKADDAINSVRILSIISIAKTNCVIARNYPAGLLSGATILYGSRDSIAYRGGKIFIVVDVIVVTSARAVDKCVSIRIFEGSTRACNDVGDMNELIYHSIMSSRCKYHNRTHSNLFGARKGNPNTQCLMKNVSDCVIVLDGARHVNSALDKGAIEG